MRSGSRSTRISRSTPPTRVTRPTPGTADSSRVTVRSTNHESSVSVMLSEATLHVTMAPPAVVTRETIGSLASGGRSERIRVIASRTSSSAAERSVPNRNSMLVVDAPSSTVEVICSMPAIVATASSTLRVISLSICVGATPGYVMVTMTAGNSMSGRSSTPSFGKLRRPATVSAMNRTMTGTGLRIDQVTKFMSRSPLTDADEVAVLQEAGALLTMRGLLRGRDDLDRVSWMEPVSMRRRATTCLRSRRTRSCSRRSSRRSRAGPYTRAPCRSRSRRARTCRAEAVVGREVDIDERRAIVRRDRRRDDANRAVERRAIGRNDADSLSRSQVLEPRIRRLAAPLDAAVAQQAEHLVTGLRDLTDRDGARGDHAVVGRYDLGELSRN